MRVFADHTELQFAVDDYISQDCAIDSTCPVAQIYGYPMNSWNVEKVIDMSELFKDTTTFNEDISGWNISNVIMMDDMFRNATSFNQNLCAWRNKFPYDYAGDIFKDSGCTFQGTPHVYKRGSFCASDCYSAVTV